MAFEGNGLQGKTWQLALVGNVALKGNGPPLASHMANLPWWAMWPSRAMALEGNGLQGKTWQWATEACGPPPGVLAYELFRFFCFFNSFLCLFVIASLSSYISGECKFFSDCHMFSLL